MKITVVLSQAEITLRCGKQAIHRGIFIMNKLRASGMPVKGSLYPEGIDEGMLSIETDDGSGVVTYVWEGDERFVRKPAQPIYSDPDEF